jgi:DNA primase
LHKFFYLTRLNFAIVVAGLTSVGFAVIASSIVNPRIASTNAAAQNQSSLLSKMFTDVDPNSKIQFAQIISAAQKMGALLYSTRTLLIPI